IMTYNQIEKVRASSKAGQNGPWVSHWEEMAKKTVIRRLFKYLPVSIEMQKAVILDEKAEANIDQENASVFEGEFEEVGTNG
ncbi:recombinase RecT, partial [Providencia stuartii]|uniref:recombinase RecT n=1 Tax=Providencia stuartii TaxID=588 RepID=UPI0018C52F07